MAKLIIGIGTLGKQIITGLNEEIQGNEPSISRSFIMKDRGGNYRFYLAKIVEGYRSLHHNKSSANLTKEISIVNYNQIFIVADIIDEDSANILILLLTRFKKENMPSFTILLEPFQGEEMDSVSNSKQTFQIMTTLFRNIIYIKLEDYSFLNRKDSYLTWRLITKRIISVIKNNIYL
jgi:hypothetical protein